MNIINGDKKEIYKHKFSFGISLGINIEDYKKIINDYKYYISSIYFSLPLGTEFHTRDSVVVEYSKKNSEETLINILKLFKNNDIKLEAVVNQYNISEDKILEAIEYLKNNVDVDSICTLDEYAKMIRRCFPKQYLVRSFNNYNITYEQLQSDNIYNEIVIGRRFLRDIKYINQVRNLGIDIKLLLNNGCSFNCATCRAGKEKCKEVFNKNIQKYSAEELYALQSFWPYELQILEQKIDLDNIKEFKISSRPCTYEYLDNCLNSYIYHNQKKEEKFLMEDLNNYRLWGRLTHFTKYFNDMSINEIKKIKKEIWKL